VSASPIDGSFYFVAGPGNAVPPEKQPAGVPIAPAAEQSAVAPASTALPSSSLQNPTPDQSGKTAPTTAATASRSAPLPAASAPDVHRFDGVWSTNYKMTWPRTASANGFVYEFTILVRDAHLHGQHGDAGKPSSLSLDGDVAADGGLVVYAQGYNGNPKFNQNNIPPGVPYAFQIPLRLDGARGTASVHLPSGRPCDFEFVKK
jgi:hypothetical protein